VNSETIKLLNDYVFLSNPFLTNTISN